MSLPRRNGARIEKDKYMSVRLDPSVIDQIRETHKLGSFEKVGAKLGRTGHTVRKWYEGKTAPSAGDLAKMQFLTGRPYGTMLIISAPEEKAA